VICDFNSYPIANHNSQITNLKQASGWSNRCSPQAFQPYVKKDEAKMRSSSLLLRVLLLAITLCVGGVWVWAHAIVVESSPQTNSVVKGAVVEVKLRFNVRIDGPRSRLALVGPNGTSHNLDGLQQPSPDSLATTLSGLLPGKYRLHWQVLAGDGHITQGDIPFTVTAPS
jgi:methionine-rich copper-binding protein CopC